MKIGVFDSGLGGLAIAQAVIRHLPQYDYLYLGDTKRVPYGGRSQETIHEFTAQALNYLFENECQLVILACNTASAEALRKSQQNYLPKFYPDRRVLGMIIPTAEAVFEHGLIKRIGVLATTSTVESQAYTRELLRQNREVEIHQVAAPLLVPLVENDGVKYLEPILNDYLEPLLRARVQGVVLGCTHYCLVKAQIAERSGLPVFSQDDIIPPKLANYLQRHPEIATRLSKNGTREYHVTDVTLGALRLATEMAQTQIELKKVVLQ